ncbi:UNVERIFIED_ORG: hypothetical protein LHK14_01505 [Roseateles sp. XES5]|nr:hypothetical protein [Roseateles sp. XES5]
MNEKQRKILGSATGALQEDLNKVVELLREAAANPNWAPIRKQEALASVQSAIDEARENFRIAAAHYYTEHPTHKPEAKQNSDKHVVILIHGIRDWALWQNEVRKTLNEHGFEVDPTNYGRFGLFRFLLPIPYFRQLAIEKIERQIRISRSQPGREQAKFSIIAHSFGTLVAANILREGFELSLNRVIFCGSILPYDFPFEQFQNRFVGPLLNEVGTRDPWPATAQSVTWGYGSAGTYGFRRPLVRDRWHNGAGHGYFLAPNFCRKFWVPFLADGTIIEDTVQADQPPWWVSLISLLNLKYWLWPLLILGFGWLAFQLGVGAPTAIERFAGAVRLNASKEAVVAAIGLPKITERFVPSAFLDESASPEDVAAVSAAGERNEGELGLYEFDGFSAEIVYSGGTVHQYTIVNRTEEPIPIDIFDDVGVWGSMLDVASVAIGKTYFSELLNGCSNLEGDYYNRDAWIKLSCPSSGATGDVNLAFGWTFLGKTYGPLMDREEESDASNLSVLGINLLTNSNTSQSVSCKETAPITSYEQAVALAPDVPSDADGSVNIKSLATQEAPLCFSLRVARPNALIVANGSKGGTEVTLSSGEEVFLSAGPQGVIAYDTYGASRSNVFPEN